MAEKKKMSVAEILAAARKSDNKGAPSVPPESTPSAEVPAPAPLESAAPVSTSPTPAEVASASPEGIVSSESAPAQPKPKAAASGSRPSVAEMMAMARAQKGGAPKAAAPAAKAAPVEKTSPKPAEKPAAKAAEKKPTPELEPNSAKDKETTSILAAARKVAKPGPVSKAEAAARLKPDVEAEKPKAKTKGVVPPMPAKPEYAKPKAEAVGAAEGEERRWFLGALFGSSLAVGFTSLATTAGLWTLGTARFMFPNVLTEPPSKFKAGFPSDYAPGQVSEKFKAQFGTWVVNGEYQGLQEIYALRTVCTHLGCTPNWLDAEQKFKCPCHGSGFYKDGINFEGPAPRPLERYAIRLGDDGQLEIDRSKTFQEEMGQWTDPACFVPV